MQRVFGIGFHKTGTSSLAEALRILGYNVCPENFAYFTRVAASVGGYGDCLMLAKEYEAFADSPWNYRGFYKVLDVVFPDSKFILTTRLSSRWYPSILRWAAMNNTMGDGSFLATLGMALTLDNEQQAIEAYLQHTADVREHFCRCPKKLLIVDWESGDGWQQLCDFLEKSVPKEPFPHRLKYEPHTLKYVDIEAHRVMAEEPTCKRAILVTGLSGSGKSAYARQRGGILLSYDMIHDYGSGHTDLFAVHEWKAKIQDAPLAVIDAWNLSRDPNLTVLKSLLGHSFQLEIHFLYTAPLSRYEAQRGKEAAGAYCITPENASLEEHAAEWNKRLGEYADKHIKRLEDMGYPVSWLFRQGDAYTEMAGLQHALEIANLNPVEELLAWIDKTSGDPLYQTIELDGKVIRQGYTESEKSWERIQAWDIDWKGAKIVDFGCFHGYFCFKAEQAGASVIIGLDRSKAAILVAKRLGLLQRSGCVFFEMEVTESGQGNADIALVMNVYHHILSGSSPEAAKNFLQYVFDTATQVILEINPDEAAEIESIAEEHEYALLHDSESHRVTEAGTRRLLHYGRRDGT